MVRRSWSCYRTLDFLGSVRPLGEIDLLVTRGREGYFVGMWGAISEKRECGLNLRRLSCRVGCVFSAGLRCCVW